jgi:hypothetical protein
MSVSCDCCVMSCRGLCDELVPRPEESYRLWCVSNVCDHETSTKRGGPGAYKAVEPYTHTHTHKNNNNNLINFITGGLPQVDSQVSCWFVLVCCNPYFP